MNKHARDCPQTFEAHVEHDLETERYRAIVRCRCGRERTVDPKPYQIYYTAELGAKALLRRTEEV